VENTGKVEPAAWRLEAYIEYSLLNINLFDALFSEFQKMLSPALFALPSANWLNKFYVHPLLLLQKWSSPYSESRVCHVL
jgi:hypothetical protein